MNTLSKGLPPALRRDAELRQTSADLGAGAARQTRAAGQAWVAAELHSAEGVDQAAQALGHSAEAAFEAGRAAGAAALGVGTAVVGQVVGAGAVLLNQVSAALQRWGQALISVGNAVAPGGDQVVTQTVVLDKRGEGFAGRMARLSGEHFARAGKQWLQSVRQLSLSTERAADCAGCVLAAAEKTVEAAGRLGDAAVLRAAQGSVVLAREALMATAKGTQNAATLLQEAGAAVLEAGNMANTRRATDYTVQRG